MPGGLPEPPRIRCDVVSLSAAAVGSWPHSWAMLRRGQVQALRPNVVTERSSKFEVRIVEVTLNTESMNIVRKYTEYRKIMIRMIRIYKNDKNVLKNGENSQK